ncbi:MAG: hypothetical protein K6356_00375 [Chloroflexus sp.]
MASAQADLAMLVMAVRQAGGEPERVGHVLELVRQRLLADNQLPAQTLYVYRVMRTNQTAPASVASSAPSRTLLAFLSADTAVSFAQRTGLARAPRLHTLSLARLLVAFLQQPGFSALHIAYDDSPSASGLPAGWHLTRPDVLAWFAIDSGVV